MSKISSQGVKFARNSIESLFSVKKQFWSFQIYISHKKEQFQFPKR